MWEFSAHGSVKKRRNYSQPIGSNHTPEFHWASKAAESDIADIFIKYIQNVRGSD